MTVVNDVYDGDAAPARVYDVQCNGGENQLVDCPHKSPDGTISCAAYMGPAGVVCHGKIVIELVLEGVTENLSNNDPDSTCSSDSASVRLSEEQVVEVCAGGFRTGVCSSNWDDTDASVVCRQLSLGDNGGMLFILLLIVLPSWSTQLLAR